MQQNALRRIACRWHRHVPGDVAGKPLRDGTLPRDGSSGAAGGDASWVESLIVWLIVGAIAGWLAGLIVRGFGFGLIGNIVVGIVGAVIAGWLLPSSSASRCGGGIVAAIINAVIGAVILLVIIGLIRRASTCARGALAVSTQTVCVRSRCCGAQHAAAEFACELCCDARRC